MTNTAATTTTCLRLRRGRDLRARRTALLRDMRRPLQSPLSLPPGAGAECSKNLRSATDTSVNGAAALWPDFAADPTGPFPAHCASFDQLGVRVPFLAISPFSKQHCVSHTVGDHTSILAFIEKRFMSSGSNDGDDDSGDRDNREVTRQFLTKRDKHAHTLEDMFDFDGSPSVNTAITLAAPPAQDCTPK